MNIYDVIINVHLSEKATLLAEKFNQYTFKVRPQATKPEIKAAVETIFGKTVVKVNTCNYAGKKRRKGRTDEGRTNHWKKAYVKLKQGETLDLV